MYEYPVGSFRANVVRVVDGDTLDLELDIGFHLRKTDRFRLLGVNAYELNAKDQGVRSLARKGLTFVINQFVNAGDWALRVVTQKDPDNFGRWLADVYYVKDGAEVSLSEQLLSEGLAVPYKR